MLMENKLQKTKIGDTPLSISIYSVTSSPTHINDPDILEIVLCLKGCVNFSCGYDDFTLMPGEYVVVDRDAFSYTKDEIIFVFPFFLICRDMKIGILISNISFLFARVQLKRMIKIIILRNIS